MRISFLGVAREELEAATEYYESWHQKPAGRRFGLTTGMSNNAPDADPPALKDPDAEHPIAGAWRPMLREVVRRLVQGDYELAHGVPGVEPVTAATALQIREYIADYGATLVELSDDTWQTSVAQWTGSHWIILVDLWTAEEGRSDMVLEGKVVESRDGPRLTIHLVYVP